MKIVIDGFGGDNAPDEVLKGTALAVKDLGIEVAVTGDIETPYGGSRNFRQRD